MILVTWKAVKPMSIYNHNMNHGQGGQRRVTAKGWSLLTLLELLPEIPQREELEMVL